MHHRINETLGFLLGVDPRKIQRTASLISSDHNPTVALGVQSRRADRVEVDSGLNGFG